MKSKSHPASGPTRREFVILTSAAAVGLAAKLSADTVVVVPGTQHGALPILSVGYWNGNLASQENSVPGGRILLAGPGVGDGVYSRHGAEIRVVGFWRAPKNRSKSVSVSLLPLYPATDRETNAKPPAISWNLAVNEQGLPIGPIGSRFNVPLDSDQRVEIAVQKIPTRAARRRAASAASIGNSELQSVRAAAADPSAILQFGVLNSRIALNSGIYFIALREEDRQDTPEWGLLRVRNFRVTDPVDPTGDGILMSLSGAPLPFDYVVLAISPYLDAAA